ncbi:MAG: hypothetical protein WBF81_05980 [Thermoplasmata archaeon]
MDLSAWAAPTKAPPTAESTPTTPRQRDPKVDWWRLGGMAGLAIVRIAQGVSEKTEGGKTTSYPWVGVTVHLPPTDGYPSGKNVFVLTSVGTVAGTDLVNALRRGTFDGLPDVPVPVRVRNQKSEDYPSARPMSFLTFG